jgi:hypothetical protein
MCLTKLKSQRKAIKRLFKDRKEIICYKVLTKHLNALYFLHKYLPEESKTCKLDMGS